MRCAPRVLLCSLLAAASVPAAAQEAAAPPSLAGFGDAIHH